LLTDFGLRDPYVGIMKGAMLRRAPALTLVDLSHEVAAQDLSEAAFWLARSHAWFAPGTVHLVVVDPGVGTERRALAVCARGHYFVAPDNGVLEGVLARPYEARQLDETALELNVQSRTFHGRDIFGPAAALLASSSLPFARVGPVCDPLERRRLPSAEWQGETLVATVVSVDRFGNLITNAERSQLDSSDLCVELAGRSLPMVATYAELAPGECGALLGSFDTVEVACREGNASAMLGVGRGSEVRFKRVASPS
jgi:hypothetical protein